MPEPIITVENLGKRYRLQHQAKQPYSTLRGAITDAARGLFSGSRRKGSGDTPAEEDFWALRDVGFEVQCGEVMGIVGRNGAGKSTLLKLVSRITEPTIGRIRLRGRVASLLEVGTGFHPELTGRENIFLNGAILGMTKSEIRAKFDEIVAFAEVERFLDTPVKHYSSGMYVRLAFAVAAHLEPEILIVDEVLAVGDSQFQQKCMGKMRDVANNSGRTVLFVSHNLSAINALCTRAMLLHQGNLVMVSGTAEVIDQYRSMSTSQHVGRRRPPAAGIPLVIAHTSPALTESEAGHTLAIDLVLESRGPHDPAFIAFDIVASNGVAVMQALPTQVGFVVACAGCHRIRTVIDLPPLVPGVYAVTAWVGTHYSETLDVAVECATFEILRSPTSGRTVPHTPDHGFIVPASRVVEHTVGELDRVYD